MDIGQAQTFYYDYLAKSFSNVINEFFNILGVNFYRAICAVVNFHRPSSCRGESMESKCHRCSATCHTVTQS